MVFSNYPAAFYSDADDDTVVIVQSHQIMMAHR